jgi:hypothetical protein
MASSERKKMAAENFKVIILSSRNAVGQTTKKSHKQNKQRE